LGLSHIIHLMDERKNIAEITAGLDIANSCSFSSEGFSNTIGESMACGVPIVATEVGDSSEIIGNAGIIVPPKNPPALAKAWQAMLEMPIAQRMAMGTEGTKRIEAQFSLKTITHRYQTLYQSVV